MFELQGHRGARGLFPENTLPGFRGALAIGVSSLELDIGVTADDVPVVIHEPSLDPDLTRDADGTWLPGSGPPVRALTLDALRRFDVGRARPGSATALAFPQQQPADGAPVPTLAELFALTARTQVRIDAELKTDPRAPAATVPPERMAELVVATARACGALGRLRVRSFDWRGLAWLRRCTPEIPLCWLTSASTEADAALWWNCGTAGRPTADMVAAAAADGPPIRWTPMWAPAHAALSAASVGEAAARGLSVVPWTVNAPDDMARLIGWGVHGMCTDRPDLARAEMARAGLPLPPAVIADD
jgi:glycerophosphoryl diester phosphodiesterase